MAAEVATQQQNSAVADDKPAVEEQVTAEAVAVGDKQDQTTGDAAGTGGGGGGGEGADGANDAKKDGDHEANNTQAAASKTEAPPKYSVHKTNFEKDVIYLYQFSRTPLLPSLSPYCLKVETWLRLAGLKYEVCTITMACI
ncbi:failed axon connections-like [Condylostylus longicornis]|uniref:failed axon connections-like n=1 Tax=Condylostylus longicornis TaxID=2530218 RepID=UPI00244DCEA9|nr:failed axon connections-like [Condylostylus longicornis]